jgi:S1-C subfamily serine protease
MAFEVEGEAVEACLRLAGDLAYGDQERGSVHAYRLAPALTAQPCEKIRFEKQSMISSSYKLVRNSIVAFVAKYVTLESGGPPQFPPIIGTGFVVREDGVIATNAHVIQAFGSLPRPADAPKDEFPVYCLMLKLIDKGMVEIPLEILGTVGLRLTQPEGAAYYGPKTGPDLAFVHVKARGLPAVALDIDGIDEGTEVATAGFPMGTDALLAPGWIHQVTPTLQRGIISAVLPFVCPTPHAYAVNIMVQGGASGSPVFLSETGKVVGILFAGLNDPRMTLAPQQIVYTVPTNISYVVPAHYIVTALEHINPFLKPSADAKSIEEMLDNARFNNALVGRQWAQWGIRQVDSHAESARVTSLCRVQPAEGEKFPPSE